MHWYLREHQVVCEGDLDEDTRLDDVEFPPGHLCLDLEGIRKVNSAGIHTLIITIQLRTLTADSNALEVAHEWLRSLSPTMTRQSSTG